MYTTDHGDFDGNSWEAFCQLCFKLKFANEGYQELPAYPGDLGIEGYTRTGIVFQCYCPNENYNADILYTKQRDKITKDLGKLITYRKELKKYLGNVLIEKWIFVTPKYQNKDLVRHCAEKAEEYRQKNMDILSPNFDVLVHDLDFFTEQIPLILDGKSKKVAINHNDETNENTTSWVNSKIDLVENANRKNSFRIPENVVNRASKIDRLTQITISNFLDGNLTINQLEQRFPNDYENLVRVISQYEKKVEELCLTNSSNSNIFYESIETELKSRIKNSITYLDDTTINRLTEQVLADWILRCPIDFE